MKKVLLLGYMGSGKSVTGKLLANYLHIPFYDLDDLIENQLQMTISDIFKQNGEIFFRKIEHEIFQKIMGNEENFVLSLGGGTPCYANNHLLFRNSNCVSFYLNASIPLLVSRLESGRSNRPLIAHLDGSELTEYVAKHLFDRSYFYNQAHFIVKVDGKSSDQIVSEIDQLLT